MTVENTLSNIFIPFRCHSSIDENLPKAMLDATQVILHALGTIFVTLTVNPIFSIPIVVMAIIFIFVRRLYLKTSKNIKRLEGMSKSKVIIRTIYL